MTLDDDRPLAWHEVPPEVRQAVLDRTGQAWPAGHAIWACPRRKPGGWFKPDSVRVEYWWVTDEGELIDILWLT